MKNEQIAHTRNQWRGCKPQHGRKVEDPCHTCKGVTTKPCWTKNPGQYKAIPKTKIPRENTNPRKTGWRNRISQILVVGCRSIDSFPQESAIVQLLQDGFSWERHLQTQIRQRSSRKIWYITSLESKSIMYPLKKLVFFSKFPCGIKIEYC